MACVVRVDGPLPPGTYATDGVVIFSQHGRAVELCGGKWASGCIDLAALKPPARRVTIDAVFREAKELRTTAPALCTLVPSTFPFGWDALGALTQALGGTMTVAVAQALMRCCAVHNKRSAMPVVGALLAEQQRASPNDELLASVIQRMCGRGANPQPVHSLLALFRALYGATAAYELPYCDRLTREERCDVVLECNVDDGALDLQLLLTACRHRRPTWAVVFQFGRARRRVRIVNVGGPTGFYATALEDAVRRYVLKFSPQPPQRSPASRSPVARMAVALGTTKPGVLDRRGRRITAAQYNVRSAELMQYFKRPGSRTTRFHCFASGRTGDGMLKCQDPRGRCGQLPGDADATPTHVAFRRYENAIACGVPKAQALAGAAPPCATNPTSQRDHGGLMELESFARFFSQHVDLDRDA